MRVNDSVITSADKQAGRGSVLFSGVKRGKIYCIAAIAAAVGVMLAINPQAVSQAVAAAVSDCLEVIIPSLFAFTVLTVYIQNSGLWRYVLFPMTKPLSWLLRLDEELCGIMLLSSIGGYPVGARLISEMVRRGRLSLRDSGRMMCFCFGSGPAFVIGLVGVRVFGSVKIGAAIFAACFLSSLVIAMWVRRSGEIVLLKGESGLDLSINCFIAAVMDGARVMMTVCVMIVGFSVITALLRTAGVYAAAEKLLSLTAAGENSGAILSAVLEVSQVKQITPVRFAAPLCAALLSFGGVCVLLQVGALARGLPLRGFILSRFAAAVLSAVFALPALLLEAPAVQAFAGRFAVQTFSVNGALSLCVLGMCVTLLGECGKS